MDLLRELADQIVPGSTDPLIIRKGVIQASSSPTVTIRLGGSTTDIAGVPKCANYTPVVGHVVLILQQGPAMIVVDRIG